MSKDVYRKILACLHPDWITDPTMKKRYEEAFRLFNELKLLLLDEKEHPTPGRPSAWPRTYEEMMALRQKVSEKRKAKSGVNL